MMMDFSGQAPDFTTQNVAPTRNLPPRQANPQFMGPPATQFPQFGMPNGGQFPMPSGASFTPGQFPSFNRPDGQSPTLTPPPAGGATHGTAGGAAPTGFGPQIRDPQQFRSMLQSYIEALHGWRDQRPIRNGFEGDFAAARQEWVDARPQLTSYFTGFGQPPVV